MPHHRLIQFSNPAILQTISIDSLLRLLGPYAEFLGSRDCRLLDGAVRVGPHYEQLAAILMSEGIPAPLGEALFYIDALANPEGMDALLQAYPELDPPWHSWTPADMAVRAWLADRDRFEQVFAERQLSGRSRKFVSYPTRAEAPPAIPELSSELVRSIEAAIRTQLAERGRGHGTRVSVAERPDGTWFLVRRGDPLRREACLEDERSSSVLFRPERYDAVILAADRSELRINASTRWQRELYRRAFGLHLTGDMEAFRADDRYTLSPLVTDIPAALACHDIRAIAHVRLLELEFVEPGSITHGGLKWADDLWGLIASGGWSIPPRAQLTAAKFSVQFVGARTPRLVMLRPPNEVRYAMDDDGLAVEQWLENRGFVVMEGGDDDDVEFEPILAFPGATGGSGRRVRRVATLFGT